jgi:hypothetical protein
MKNLLLFSLLVFMISCGDDKLKKVETLTSFRVLAIETATPELTQTTGLSVTARPYISDTNGAGRTISAVVDGCIDPGISFGAEVTCEGNASKVSVAYSINTSTLTNLNSGWGTYSSSLSIPDTIFAGRTDRDKYNGVPYIIVFKFTVDGAEHKSFRRILVTNRTALNSNPTLSGFLLNGSTLAKPNLNDYLSATVSNAENYNFILVDGTTENRNESLTMAWYVSSGELNTSKVNASESVQYKSSSPSTSLLIIGVLRDERGGVSVKESLL